MDLKNYIYNKCENRSMMVKNFSNLNVVQFLLRILKKYKNFLHIIDHLYIYIINL